MRDQVNNVPPKTNVYLDVLLVPMCMAIVSFLITWDVNYIVFGFLFGYTGEALLAKVKHDVLRIKR